MPTTNSLPSLSQVEKMSSQHLIEAAAFWIKTAELWEDSFAQVAREIHNPGGTLWEGEAADRAQSRGAVDLVRIREAARQLHDAAAIARMGAEQLDGTRRAALAAVRIAHADEYRVTNDFSVIDTRVTHLRGEQLAREADAQRHSNFIRHRVAALVAADREAATRITAATEGVAKLSFDESPIIVAPLDHGPAVPPAGIVWCKESGKSFSCRELLPDGTIVIFPLPVDVSGHWPD